MCSRNGTEDFVFVAKKVILVLHVRSARSSGGGEGKAETMEYFGSGESFHSHGEGGHSGAEGLSE